MSKAKLLLSCVVVGVIVALTYYFFEYAVHQSITFIWDTTFNTGDKRLLVVPLCVSLSLLFFGLQHFIDPKSENHQSQGLGGDTIIPSLRILLVILLLGYFSLIAGASLGPEAVLVPASVVIGLLLGVKLFKKDTKAPKALAAAAIMALMAAFFHSFFIGILSIFLVKKQAKIKISAQLVIVALISSASSMLTLNYVDPTNKYFNFPNLTWKVAVADLVIGIGLALAGFCATYGLKYVHTYFTYLRLKLKGVTWWKLALLSSLILSVLYLLGGPLVEFTGNESIAPVIHQASSLGFGGLVVITIVKILAIAWSKAMGYRGGLVFPMIFVASSLVAIAQLIYHDVSFGIGIISAMIGILVAEKKAKILF